MGALLDKHGRTVASVLRRSCPFVRDLHQIESALHDGAMAMWKVAKRLDTEMSLGAYFYKVCYRKLLRLARKEPPLELLHPTWVALLTVPDTATQETTAFETTTPRVAAALQRLSPRECEVLAADIASNFRDSAPAIAKALGTTTGTVYNARVRIKDKLKHLIKDEQDGAEDLSA